MLSVERSGNAGPGARTFALLLVTALLLPSLPAMGGPPVPPRTGAEVVNPFIATHSYTANWPGFEAFDRVGLPNDTSLSELGEPFTPSDFTSLNASDDDRWVTDKAIIEGALDTQIYHITVNATDVNASSLVFNWEGFGEFQPGPQTFIMAYNHALSRWVELARFGFTKPVDLVLTGEISGNVSDYIQSQAITLLVASEKGRIKSSCPMLFTWNGTGFEFITDFLGDGIIGMPVLASLIRFPADPTEYLVIGSSKHLEPVEGKYQVRIVEELEEVTYLDSMYLMAVDHPAGTEAHPNERGMYFPPWPEYGMLVFDDARDPVAAWDDQGNDVLELISAHDRRYPPVPLSSFKEGFAQAHDLYLDLGAFPQGAPVQLLLDSWIRFVRNDDDNFYANTQGWYDGPPSIAVSDGNGSYTVVNDNIGIPMGLPKTWVVNMTGMFPSANHTVRISSRIQIYFDEIRVTTNAGSFPFATTNVTASAADLHFLGFPKFKSPDGRRPYAPDYSDVTALSPWRNQPGNYTRFGDVLPLLYSHDDQYVVMGPGDEISLEFDASAFPPVPDGWVRDFVYFVDGYMKEIHPAVPEDYVVDPLPYHNMTFYPYGGTETFPNDPVHQAYQAQYNTRYVGPGGAWPGNASVETDFVQLDAYQPATLPSLSVPLTYNATAYPQVRFYRSTVFVDGNITVEAGATLTLDHAKLFMNGSGTRILVQAGGSLRILNGSVVSDSPSDIDDGSPSDGHYWIEVEPGAELVVCDSVVENAGDSAGSIQQHGIYVNGAGVILDNSTFVGLDAALVLDGVTNISVYGFAINSSAVPDLQLLNTARVDAISLGFSALAISPDSMLAVRTPIDVVVRDGSGKPIRGVDLRLTDNSATVYASGGFGGSSPRTARVTDFNDTPLANTLFAVDRVYLGSTTPAVNVSQLSAKYFEWSETRTINASVPHAETFVIQLNTTSFADRAAALGFDQGPRNFSYWDSMGPSVAVTDFNRDGRLDLFVAGGATRGEREGVSRSPNRLYRQEASGVFTDVTDAARLSSDGATGAAWGDYNRDGNPDLYLVYHGWGGDFSALGERNLLFRNNGDGTFTNVTATSGVGDTGHGTSAAWGDYDGDGWLDLYVGNLGWIQGWFVRNESNVLFHNNGDGTFSDVTAQLGVYGGGPQPRGLRQNLTFLGGENVTEIARDSPEGSGFTMGVAWLDYDRDGDLDLFVANEFGVSVLYRNDGGTFSPATRQAGLGKVGSARGVTVADIDGDGWLDIIQANRWLDFVWHNNGDGTFTDVAPTLGLDTELPGTTPVAFDMDLDGRLDLFVGGGRINSFHTYAPSYLYSNRGAAGFADVTASAGVALGDNRTMGAAAADLNNDGRPDLVLANGDLRDNLFVNTGTGGHWLKVRLTGTASPVDGQGATVRLIPAGASTGQAAQVGAVGARGSQAPNELLFGLAGPLPQSDVPWSIEILWSSGVRQVVSVTAPDQIVDVTERADTRFVSLPAVHVNEDVQTVLTAVLSSTDPRVNATASVAWVVHLPSGDLSLSGLSPNATLPTPGTYNATVTVVDRTGTIITGNFSVHVADVTPPTARAGANATIPAGTVLSFSANGTSDNDPAFEGTGTYTWTFTDAGRLVTLQGRTTTYTFASPGTYEVTLTVRDGTNNTATARQTVTVSPVEVFGARELGILILALLAVMVLVLAVVRSRRRERPPTAPPPASSKDPPSRRKVREEE
jgi:hypothetical protein